MRGGAIYASVYQPNPSSSVNIFAKEKDVLFTNNISKASSVSYSVDEGFSVIGGKYNDFYGTNKASLYLNANSGKNIIFNGSVVSNGPAFDINADNDDNIKGGTYNFNNTVEAANMTIHNGADIKLGSYKQADNSTTYGKITASNFSNDGNGGILDSKNSAVQELNLGNVTLNSDLSWIMDAQLKGGAVTVSDNLKANSFSGTGNIIINGINILEDSDIPVMKSLVADNVLKDHIQLSTTAEITKETPVSYNYAITYDDGYLNFSKAYNLVTATRDTAAQRVYNMSSDEDIALDIADIGDSSTSIGVMGGAGSTFTINGGGNSVNGAGNSGISILDGQTLNINNVGMDANGSVKGNGFYGFNGNDENNVLNNQGTLNIVNSVFKNNDHQDTNSNYPYGTVIYNSESGRLSVKNSLFEANNNYNQGKGTLTNDGYAVISNSEFKDNYTRIYGGSINNRAKMIIGNGEENAVTKFVDNTRASLYGIGGIENRGGKLLVNEKTEFINNKGAISVDKLEYNGTTYNSTVLFDAESLFKDNSNIALNTQAGSTYVTFAKKAVFDGNSGSDAGAAKIQTSSKVLFFDSVFKNNSSTGSGGAISNGGDLYLIANNANVEFTGNKANDVSRAVYNNGIMYLNAAGGKSIIFNDDISGANNNDIRINSSGLEYRTLDSGLNDITKSITQKGGNYVFNANVENANMKLYNDATVTVGSSGGLNLAQLTSQNQGGTLDVLNNSIQTFTLGYVDIRNKDVNLKIDVNGNELAADKFVITNTDNNARVNFLISDIKFADGISDFGLEKKIRVLENPTERVGIKLSDALSDQYNVDNYQDIVEGNKKIEAVTSGGVTTASVNYNEHYGEFSRTDTVHKQLQVTKFDDNSKVDDALWWKEVSRTEGVATYDKDTLALINQSITDSDEVVKERSFNFTGTPTSEYKAISDAGVTAIGEFTINGVNNNNSIINFDGYKGFEVTDTAEKTTVNVNNVTIKGASLVANIAQGNELNLTNSIIDTGNTGGISNAGTLNVISSTINKDISGEGTTNFSGTSLNTATVTQSAASNIGTLTNRGTISTIANNAGTIDNYSIITAAQVNDGILNNSNGASVGNLSLNDGKVFNSGDVTTLGVNGGEFTNNTDGEVITLNQSAGTAVNKGKITAVTQTGGTFTNEESNGDVSTLTQSGGTSSNNGLIATLTLNGGTASNSGTITNAAVNQSTLTNNSDGEIVNLTNAATVANAGKITGTLNNTGTISDGGTITTANGINSGTITQNSLTSTGIFTNTGMISVDTLNNSGTFTNNDGGKITAAGSAVNTGSLTTNASDFKATTGLTNTGELYLTGGETQNTISGVGGTTHVKGNVIISKTISDNVISLDTVSDNVNGVARLGVNDISSAEKLLANGGDLNLQYQTGTEEYKLGNVVMQSAMGLAIDVDLTGSSEVKKADTISATSVSGSEKIYINNLNITAPNVGDAAPEYAKVADNILKGSVDLGDNTRTHVSSIPQNGFIITYAQDVEGSNTGGFLKLAYTDLVTASRATTQKRVYVMGQNDEDIVAQIDGNPAGTGYGGSGITDSNFLFGGSALSVNGNGTQSIVGGTLADGSITGGFIIGENQTLSLNNIKEVKGFTTAITNNGTVNITDTDITNNTTDIINNNILNLYGSDEIKTISGDNGVINVMSYNGSDGNPINADVTFASGGSVIQKEIVIDENNTLTVNSANFTVSDGITNDGILNLNTAENNNVISNTSSTKGTVNFVGVSKDNKADVTANLITINSGVALTNADGAKLSANTIEVKSGLVANAGDITITDDTSSIKNSGVITFVGGKNENKITSEDDYSAIKFTNVSGNTKSIEANDITINSSTVSPAVSFINEGSIKGESVVNKADFVNSGEGQVESFSVNNQGTFTTNADKVSVTGNSKELANDTGTMVLTGGTNENFKIVGGTTVIKTDATAVNDTVNIVNQIASDTFTVEKGTAHLSSDDLLNSSNRDNAVFLKTTGSASDSATLSFINSATSDSKWVNVLLDKDLNLDIDVSLSGAKADNFSLVADEYSGGYATPVFNNGSNLLLNTLSLDTATTDKKYTKILVSDANLARNTRLSDNYSIVDSNGDTISDLSVEYAIQDSKGYLIFNNTLIKNLVSYLRDKDTATYTLSDTENIADDIAMLGDVDNTTSIGSLKPNGGTFTVEGNGNAVNGASKGGMIIDGGQTLNLNNVSEMSGFSTAAIINQNGTLNINGVVLKNNTTADIDNNNILNLSGENTFDKIIQSGSTGILNVNSGKTTINSALTQKNLVVSQGAELVNDGTMNITLMANNTGKISGEGTITANGMDLFSNSGTIEQNIVNISGNTVFSNSGTLTINESGSLGNGSLLGGYGTLVNNGTFVNNGSIAQNLITNTGSFTSNADNLIITDKIDNSSNVYLTGGTLDTSIEGSGTTNITGDVIVRYIHSEDYGTTVYNKISQAIDVAKDASLNANVGSIGGDITVNAEGNDVGLATLYSQEPNGGNLDYKVTGDGKVVFNRNVNVNAEISAKMIEVSTYTAGGNSYNANVVVANGKTFGNAAGTITVNENNTLALENADDLAVGVSNSGNLNLYSGTLDKEITGNGTTHVQGVVTIAKTINDNILSLDSAVGSSASVANMGITSVGKTVTNGGDLNLQYLTDTEAYSLGNVTLSSDAALAIDVNLTGSSEVKQADNIKADAVQGDAKILINNLKITAPQSGDASPEYAKVSDNNLKNNIELGNNTKTKVDSITEKGFMITYAKDLEGENTGGYLKLQYTDLVSASRDLSSSKVYVMGGDENIASQLDGDPVGTGLGGSGINDASHPLGGQALTVNGNGTQSIIGGTLASGDKAGGFVVGEDQTLSINDVKDIKDFTTGIDNNGTVNLENVSMSNNEVDVNNDGTLNLRGEDNLDTVTGDGDTVISTYTDADGNKVKSDVTINDSLEQGSLTLSTEDDKLTNNGIVSVGSLTNAGTVDNKGTLTVKGGENNGTISGDDGETTIDGKFTNNSEISQKSVTVSDNTTEEKPFTNNGEVTADNFTNNGYTDNGENGTITADTITNEGTLITNASDLTSTNGKPVTNNGELEFTSGTNNNDIEGDGETVVSGDVENVANINNDVTVNSDGTLNNNGGSLGGAGKTVTNDGTIANDGNITGTAVNNGALTNDGNVEGEVVNNNTINNNLSIDGDVTNNGNGKIANSAGASITGGMDNKGVVDNGRQYNFDKWQINRKQRNNQ